MKDKWPHEPDAHDDIALEVWFLRILRHVYCGTRWETVEPHAARAWNENAPFNSRPWSEVRDEFASIWPEG